jgi:CheY-like chemotaxis protein
MKKVLLVEDEPLICDLVVDCFSDLPEAEITCAGNGVLGAQMIVGSHFDLALIDVGLPQISGLELAGLAANENIPVLLISGHPGVNDELQRFGYPYLAKPFGLDDLQREALRVIAESRENVCRVKASAERMLANTKALSAAVTESTRLLREIKAQHVALGLLPDVVQSPVPERGGDRMCDGLSA